MEHISVFRDEVKEYLNVKVGEVIVDATLGLGGHSLDIAKKLGKKGVLLAFEQDERNLAEAQKRLKDFEKQIVYIHDNFRNLKTRITGNDQLGKVDAILFDLGLSSPHVDESERGFSFMKEGPLDMRFDQRQNLTAADIINTYSERELADIFFHYGEERLAKKIAYLICNRRKTKPFTTTSDLAEFLDEAIPRNPRKPKRVHPATQIFQALRIAVNDELNALKEVLQQSMEVLKIGGRIVIISYHSLEDRIVKHFFKNLERPKAPPEKAIYSNYEDPIVEDLTPKLVIPSEQEISTNPRSRSAKLRAYKKVKEYG